MKTTNTNKPKPQAQKGGNKGKYILIGLGVVALAGVGIYFFTKPKQSGSLTFDEAGITPPVTPDPVTTTSPIRTGGGSNSSGFPLKNGSRGPLVRNIQEALIRKYGTAILPRFGADGIWGSELDAALLSKGLPTILNVESFTKIVGSEPDKSGTATQPKKKKFRPELLANVIYKAIQDDNFTKALSALSKIWTVSGYTKVNNFFKKKRLNGVRKTLVNGLLTAFKGSSEKKALNASFYRIGLKYNGSQWSLNGLGQINGEWLQSISNARVWNPSGKSMRITKDTILGEFIGAEKGVTRFRTSNNEELLIHTKNISYV